MPDNGKRIKDNFDKRFKSRISVVYLKTPISGSAHKAFNRNLCKALKAVLTGILGREPTQSELLGIEDLSKRNKNKTKT